jgi:hypothetical protein
MGFDKATLMIDGKPLWQRQLATLRATQPGELLISGRPDGPYSGEGVPIIVDDVPDAGPLGGLATLLRIAKHPLILVLAIDLPDMLQNGWRGLCNLVQPFLSAIGDLNRSRPFTQKPRSQLPSGCWPKVSGPCASSRTSCSTRGWPNL